MIMAIMCFLILGQSHIGELDFTNIAEIPFVFISSPKLPQNFATASKIQ